MSPIIVHFEFFLLWYWDCDVFTRTTSMAAKLWAEVGKDVTAVKSFFIYIRWGGIFVLNRWEWRLNIYFSRRKFSMQSAIRKYLFCGCYKNWIHGLLEFGKGCCRYMFSFANSPVTYTIVAKIYIRIHNLNINIWKEDSEFSWKSFEMTKHNKFDTVFYGTSVLYLKYFKLEQYQILQWLRKHNTRDAYNQEWSSTSRIWLSTIVKSLPSYLFF